MATLVKFYIEPPANGFKTILAVFPEIPYNDKFTLCYEHIGQHSGCSLQYLKGKRLATESEYLPLKKELESIGYDLKICK